MDFIEITFPSAREGSILCDLIPYWLETMNFEGFHESESGLKAYIPTHAYDRNLMMETIRLMNGEELPVMENAIQDKNWNEEWERNFNPVVIDGVCSIRAPFHKKDRSFPYEIILEPKMSFGTGHHETTSLMISEILKINLEEKHVLDAGCGTGILSILAEKKGASGIVAVDYDNWSYRNASENIETNLCRHIELIEGDVLSLKDGHYDCILANLNIAILGQILPEFEKQLNTGGSLVISGILTSDVDGMIYESNKTGLELVTNVSLNKWSLLRFKKK